MTNKDFAMHDKEKDSLPVSALQHFVFCPRQCALIHIEQEWSENVLTARGRLEHDRADSGYKEFRKGKQQISGLYIQSEKLKIHGRIDVLELEEINPDGDLNLPSFHVKGTWRVYPVEFKHGQPKQNDCDRVQLCAQVLCLEEMLSIEIQQASLFYRRIRRREDVVIDQELRDRTRNAINDLHALFKNRTTPAPVNDKRCRACSLKNICMPKRMSVKSVKYRQSLFQPQEPL